MKALRGIGIVMVFIVAATLFAYIAFVHPIGTQFLRGKVTKVVAKAKEIVQEQVRPAQIGPENAPIDARLPGTPLVSKEQTVPKSAPKEHTSLEKNGSKPRTAAAVAKNKPRPSTVENPFKLERSEFSRSDIDAIIEQRRRIKDKLGEL